MDTVDLTRRFSVVRFDDVRVPADAVVGRGGQAADQVERQLQIALVMVDAESVGAMQTAFDMTVAWAFDRYSFGRPLASYQELKHRFADMKTWLEASHAISDAAAAAVAAAAPDAAELVSAAKAYIGDLRRRADAGLRADPRRHRRDLRARHPPVPAAGDGRIGRCTARRPSTASGSPALARSTEVVA